MPPDAPLPHRLNDATGGSLRRRSGIAGQPPSGSGHRLPGNTPALQGPSSSAPRTAHGSLDQPTAIGDRRTENTTTLHSKFMTKGAAKSLTRCAVLNQHLQRFTPNSGGQDLQGIYRSVLKPCKSSMAQSELRPGRRRLATRCKPTSRLPPHSGASRNNHTDRADRVWQALTSQTQPNPGSP